MEHVTASSAETDSDSFEPESLTVLQAARRAGVTQSAIIRWIRNGYLPATSSTNGWLIPAEKLDEAHAAADESRGTGPAPRQTGPRLMPAPAELRRSLAVQTHEQPARLDIAGEAIVSPLVELIRDQNDIVHDQAEVIGWLQAERSRLNTQLAELKQQPASQAKSVLSAANPPAVNNSNHDEVVSWLWNDTDRPFDRQDDLSQPDAVSVEPATAEDSEPAEPESQMNQDIWTSDPLGDEQAKASTSVIFRTGPAPVLQPIVPRDKMRSTVEPDMFIGAGSDAELRQMIDKTEAKIFNLWRAEAENQLNQGAVGLGDDDTHFDGRGNPFWQRLWPLNRRSS